MGEIINQNILPNAGWSGPETFGDAPKRVTFPITGTGSDVEQIIGRVDDLALQYGKSEYVFAFARYLIRDITANNFVREHYNRVANFVLEKVVYVADPRGAEYVRSPVQMLTDYRNRGYTQGDCDDTVLLTNSLANALGFDTRVVAVTLKGSDYPNHVVSQVMIQGLWRWFDGCNKGDPTRAWTGAMLFSK